MTVIRYNQIEAYEAVGRLSPADNLKKLGCKILRSESVDKGEFLIMELDRLPDPMPHYIEVEPGHRFYTERKPTL